jgi:hypothetical protein
VIHGDDATEIYTVINIVMPPAKWNYQRRPAYGLARPIIEALPAGRKSSDPSISTHGFKKPRNDNVTQLTGHDSAIKQPQVFIYRLGLIGQLGGGSNAPASSTFEYTYRNRAHGGRHFGDREFVEGR